MRTCTLSVKLCSTDWLIRWLCWPWHYERVASKAIWWMWRHPIGQWLNFDRTRALELTQALKLLPWAAAVTARVIYVTRQIQHKWSHYMLIWLINLQPCFCAKCCVIWGKWTSVCLSLKGRNVLNIRFLEANQIRSFTLYFYIYCQSATSPSNQRWIGR